MGAIPNKLPGFQDIERDDEARARFEAAWGATIRPEYGWHLTQMFHGMERGELRDALRDRREPGAVRGRHQPRRASSSRSLDFLVVQDILFTKTAEMADVVFPVGRVVVRGRGHGDEQRATRAARAQGARSARRGARRHRGSSPSSRAGSGTTGRDPIAEDVWDELRSLSPMHAGMSYARLEELGGIQWPCPDEEHPGVAVPARAPLGATRSAGRRRRSRVVEAQAARSSRSTPTTRSGSRPAAGSSRTTPAPSRTSTRSPLHRGESLDLSPEDAERLEFEEGEIARVSSRRGSVEAPVRIDPSLRPGLAFMTFHFPDEVDTNQLTIDATDPKSGTAEFKAAAIRVEKLEPAERAERRSSPDAVEPAT